MLLKQYKKNHIIKELNLFLNWVQLKRSFFHNERGSHQAALASPLDNKPQIFYRNRKVEKKKLVDRFDLPEYFLRELLSVKEAFSLLCRGAFENVDALSKDWVVGQRAIVLLISKKAGKLEESASSEVCFWIDSRMSTNVTSFRNPHYLEIKSPHGSTCFSACRVSWAIRPSIVMFITQYFTSEA